MAKIQTKSLSKIEYLSSLLDNVELLTPHDARYIQVCQHLCIKTKPPAIIEIDDPRQLMKLINQLRQIELKFSLLYPNQIGNTRFNPTLLLIVIQQSEVYQQYLKIRALNTVI